MEIIDISKYSEIIFKLYNHLTNFIPSNNAQKWLKRSGDCITFIDVIKHPESEMPLSIIFKYGDQIDIFDYFEKENARYTLEELLYKKLFKQNCNECYCLTPRGRRLKYLFKSIFII
jgi:hypothetical protein